MKRKLLDQLVTWKNQTRDRMPLLLYGARQVGKTYLMKELGENYFKNMVYVNFEREEKLIPYFEHDISPDYMIRVLESFYHTRIIPEETLIIFDEIQVSEKALSSLKYFAEEAPEYHVLAAGSLLGVAINRERYSFPVGKVQMLTLYPLDFEEYLWAEGKKLLAETIREHYQTNRPIAEVLHHEAMQLYYEYLIVGGMPAAVAAQVVPVPTLRQDEIRALILNSYIADMAKYANNAENVKIFAAFDSLPMQLAKDNKKFQYKLIKSGARASQYGESIDWLIRAGIVLKCGKCVQGFMPPSAYQDLTSFKLYFSDTGLLASRTNMTLQALGSTESEHFRGIFTENYVASSLTANGYELLYWESDGKAEVDFIIVKDHKVIPVECKAATHVKAKSLSVYKEKYHPDYSIRISARNFGYTDGVKAVPLYAVFCV